MEITQIVLASHPAGTPVLTDFRTEQIELQEVVQEGEVLLRTEYISVDPYLRGLMNDSGKPGVGFSLNEPIAGSVLASVIHSKSDQFVPGQLVTGQLPWATKCVASAAGLQKIDNESVSPSASLGVLGLSGLTGYFGFTAVGHPKAGDTVVISGAAGAVGTVVGQIARLKGCRVVGIAGSDQKVRMLKEELGFHEAVNYKSKGIAEDLKKACPDGIDIYFDNTGGPVSEIAIQQINAFARVVVCGQISGYNGEALPSSLNILPILLNKSATAQGYHVPSYQKHFPEAIIQLTEWLQAGQLINKETVINGIERLPAAFIGLFSGTNEGKMLVKV